MTDQYTNVVEFQHEPPTHPNTSDPVFRTYDSEYCARSLLAAVMWHDSDQPEYLAACARIPPDAWPDDTTKQVAAILRKLQATGTDIEPTAIVREGARAGFTTIGSTLSDWLNHPTSCNPDRAANDIIEEFNHKTFLSKVELLHTVAPKLKSPEDARIFMAELDLAEDVAPTNNTGLCNVAEWLNEPPPPTDWIFVDLLPSKCTMGVAGQGGLGKGFLMLQAAISLASGVPLFEFLQPNKPEKVMYYSGEDPPDVLHRRFRAIIETYSELDNHHHLLNQNLRVFASESFPMMKMNKLMNPEPTAKFDDMLREVNRWKPRLVIFDPRAQFNGLPENDNTLASEWYRNIRRLYATVPCSVVVVQHVAKQRQDESDSSAVRGASANRDDVRTFLNLTNLSATEIAAFGITRKQDWAKLENTKANYAPRSDAVYLHRREDGVLEQMSADSMNSMKDDTSSAVIEQLQNKVIETIKTERLSKREVLYTEAGSKIRATLKQEFGRFATRKHVEEAIDNLLKNDSLKEVEEQNDDGKGKTKLVLRVTNLTSILNEN